MVSFTKFFSLSLAAFSTVNAASVGAASGDLVARDYNKELCGCNNNGVLDIIYKVEDLSQHAVNHIAQLIDSDHPDNTQIGPIVGNVTEAINGLLNYGHGSICVDGGLISVVVDLLKVQIDLIKSLLANIGLFPFNIINSIIDLCKAFIALVSAIFAAINTKKDIKCFLCTDVEVLNNIATFVNNLIKLVDPNAAGLPALSCTNSQ